ncbi:serine/threonine-protein kinase bri1-like 2 [Phtheirospermum japonicum]|uniref:Serine/threonine-protein kinase bri1-like 2 n=1 Tax=Phtheirospermum japonicum TaxID=374723 RepID=A0A830CAB8_9LAMI|nr:serine/threonine-protein kinase bri1-like 2 [Phtheirospermum japonicum]
MTSLVFLDLSYNSLHQKADWISGLMWDKCHLKSLNLMGNQFYGDISVAFKNLSGCASHELENLYLNHNEFNGQLLDVSLSEGMKGMMLEYTGSISSHLVNLDLSSNHLVGKIPSELTNLTGLIGLNLSHNHLRGTIPRKIGDMSSLESLDLSSNNLHGTISGSLSKLTYLSHLNLSNNNLWGQIPTGPQLQTFNNLSYEGNPGLCGAPLLKKCHTRKVENDAGDDDGNMITDKIYLYAFIISGLATGFWGYFGVLVFKRSWRLALFRHMDALIGKMLGRY